MCSVIFGVPWSSLTEKKYRNVPHLIEVSNVRVGCLIEAGGSKNMKIDKYLFPASIAARNQFVKFVNDIIRQGMAMSGKGSLKGAFALLRDATDPETQEPLSFKELCGESATLVVAGTVDRNLLSMKRKLTDHLRNRYHLDRTGRVHILPLPPSQGLRTRRARSSQHIPIPCRNRSRSKGKFVHVPPRSH